MNLQKLLKSIIFFVLGCLSSHPLYANENSDLLLSAKYADLRVDFLNISPLFLSEIKVDALSSTEQNNVLNASASTQGLRLQEYVNGAEDWYIYGAKHICQNKIGEDAICWHSTGGSIGGVFHPTTCGNPIGGDFSSIVSGDICGTTTEWSSLDFFLNAFDNTDYIIDSFPSASTMPVNRLCVEIEWPVDKLAFSDSDLNAMPELSQIVNPTSTHTNLKEIEYEWGTYTAPRTNSSGGTTDDEVGGTYQAGGAHFYHKPTSYGSYPADKIYAVDENTLVSCISSIPTGVRAGMRPTYAANPLLTIGGDDANGITNAAAYLNYVTRIYFRFNSKSSTATYPFDIKINRLWVMYEKDEILAVSDQASKISQLFTEDLAPVVHKFRVLNYANENRSYRVFLGYGNIQPITGGDLANRFQLYIDSNKNGTIDNSDIQIAPYSNTIFTANTHYDFLLRHTPKFDRQLDSPIVRHGRRFAQGTISFIETNRLRSTSIAIRTWEASSDDDATVQAAFLTDAAYPSMDGAWNINKQFNADSFPNTNPNLVRNQPDFKYYLGQRPVSPTSIVIE